MKYGLIAGNGRFPVLVLQEARRLGHEAVVVAIKEEASVEVESLASRCHWISLGQLGRLIEILKAEGITEVTMAGQVKHAKIFSSIVPDWRLLKLLTTLPQKNTDSLIGGVAKLLEDEGIRLADSTALLKPLMAAEGSMTRRKPSREESADIEYGRRIAHTLAGFDIGQSVAVSDRACVAVEAMEGTDAMAITERDGDGARRGSCGYCTASARARQAVRLAWVSSSRRYTTGRMRRHLA